MMKRTLRAASLAAVALAAVVVLAVCVPQAVHAAPGMTLDHPFAMAMAVAAGFTAQGTFTPDGILASADNLVTHKITLLSGENRKRGTVLGKITASGKYKMSASASNDGSEAPAVVLAEDCDASGGDKVTIAHFAGNFDENALTYGTGWAAASVREALRDLGVNLHASTVR